MASDTRLENQARFAELYQATYDRLWRYAARVSRSRALADDIVQESYLRALSSPSLPADIDQARAFLFRIASNLLVDNWRRSAKERSQELHDAIEEAPVAEPGLRLDLARLFDRLKPRERQLIWLAHVEGLDHPTIGRMLGLGSGSVKVLLHRARARFAAMLRESGYAAE